ncbi:M28 family metallopeptidase [Agromyces sp. PvR057]|uniref:M28 family metallopeptidase n=1 Tax=Agromyces sp. PvR057 TaxID=3156403 RepID=UPI003396D868
MMRRTAPRSRDIRTIAIAATAAVALVLVPTSAAFAGGSASAAGGPKGASAKCDNRNNNTLPKLLECASANGVIEHLNEFQQIADENGGNRAAGLPGYDASVEYVVDTLESAGWNVTLDEFPFTFIGPSTLTQTAPIEAEYETGSFTGTGYGPIEGTIVPVDVVLTAPYEPVDSGCEVEDFTGLDFTGPSDIALIQRGTCEFGVKAANAQAAGAEAVIIFNQGNTPERSGLITGTLFGENTEPLDIPVVGASFEQGVALAQAGSTASIFVPAPEERPQVNVIAELPGKNDGNVVMAGAHLDSVQAGPGINDNGSGSAALIEIAQALGKLKPENTLRFAWWGAEESGLLGSAAYVDGLSQPEKDEIALYLNFDMIASPNSIYMVYDSDESGYEAPVVVPEGSIAIEDLFESYFTLINKPYDDAEFSGRSDYEAFILNGIPAGGLFTGAEVVKTEQQAAIWGGTAGEQFDQCYHLVCDTIDNIDEQALYVNMGAIATAVLTYAYSTEDVNGVKGKKLPFNLLPAPAGPEGTVGGGGGLAPDRGHDHGPLEAS